MTKAVEKKLIKQIKKLIGEHYDEADDILIEDLIDWLKISEKAKSDLAESVESGARMDWQSLTTISMSSKTVQSILKNLGITVTDRLKAKLLEKNDNGDALNNLNKFLND